jgi:hypothetical protein
MSRLVRASRVRAAHLVLVLSLALVAAACSDPFKLTATRPNVSTTLEAWAISGTAPTLPSVLIIPGYTMTRPDAAGSFDIAFDVDSNGKLVVLPVGSVVRALAGTRNVAFLRPAESFESILEAPTKGWTNDSLLTLNVGDVFLVRIATLFCQFELRQQIYSKYRVDSIIAPERRAILSSVIDPNCGFRSFQTGIPAF